MFFGISMSEMVLIAVVALVFIGPKRLPEVMRQAGRMFVHLRRMSFELKNSLDEVVQEAQKQMDLEKLAQMKEAKPKVLPESEGPPLQSVGYQRAVATEDQPLPPSPPPPSATASQPTSSV